MVKKRDKKAQNSEAEAAEGPRFIHNSQSKWTTANTPAGEGPGSRGPRTTPGGRCGAALVTHYRYSLRGSCQTC